VATTSNAPNPTQPTRLVVVGAQWGDEGKAKVIDHLAADADVIVRSQGGCNAGHTVCHEGHTYKFHHLPSGVLYPHKQCVISAGVVLSPLLLQQEIEALKAKGFSLANLFISDRCHITLPYHIDRDQEQEVLRTVGQEAGQGGRIGTTGRGIGPTYMDKVGRMGLRVADLFDPPEVLQATLTRILHQKQLSPSLTLPVLLELCHTFATILKPHVCDTVPLLQEALKAKAHLLFEGAQGTLLDVDFGTYPFVTSSNAVAGGASTGSGVGPSQMSATLGVMKTYLTRVGEGPFPTELENEAGEYLCQKGHEYGTTTGRKRRTGWFDTVVARYSVAVNGLDGLAMTKLDVLDELETIPVAIGYQHRHTKEPVEHFPASLHQLAQLEPVYEYLPGWQQPTTHCTQWSELPANCQAFLQRLETLCQCPIWMVSVGPDRGQTLFKHHPFHPASTPAP
jgi:adenylosuccinate synthase